MVIKKHISTLESLNFHFLLDESLLEPYVSKGTCTVLRRGKESNFFLLSDYWLLQNKKKYKKRDYYQILKLKGSCKDVEKRAKKLGNDKLVCMYTMAAIKDNTSLDFLPNYVTLKNGLQIDKAEYVDMAIRTEAFIKANGRYPAIVYIATSLSVPSFFAFFSTSAQLPFSLSIW